MTTSIKSNPTIQQNKASNPDYSVWVSASAGTGKTKILVDRLLRLLLKDNDIDKILCITYSKAAAQEMINRLMSILSKWSITSEELIRSELQSLTGLNPTNKEIAIAKELFYTIVNHPKELKIQTIHSFCQNILTRFPIEAKIPPNFVVIEEHVALNIKNQAVNNIISSQIKISTSDKDIENILSHVVKNISQYSFEKIIKESLNYSEKIELINIKYPENFKEKLYDYLSADINIKSESLKPSYLESINNTDWIKFIKIFESYEIVDETLLKLDTFLKYSIEQQEKNFLTWKNIFLTKENTTRKFVLKKDILKKIKHEEGFVLDLINNESERLILLIEKEKIQITAELNSSLMSLIFKIYDEYQNLKAKHSYLDFNDLIMKTYDLLRHEGISQWIMYKLDKRIDHILVDESQDTSPMQWEIIKTFADEFFSGNSAKEDENRTIFVVGDIKQSIYSFQGADPYYFNKTKEYLSDKIRNVNKKFIPLSMNTSFRSATGIINLVNHISKNIFDTKKDPYISENLIHEVFHQDKPFVIEVWPLISVNKEENNGDKYQKLAQAIVKKIAFLNKEQGISYGDILILYRKRKGNITLDYIVKLLKDNNIPVIGIDKINLKNNIAIQDIISLAKFLSQPKDSFSLSCILKSPLFELTDKDIFITSTYNTQKYLFENLYYTHNSLYQCLQSWINMVDFVSVFDLFYHIIYGNNQYSKEKNITKFIKRLGIDVIDPLSEFMNLIIYFKNQSADNLQSFIQFIENYETDISRENSNNKDFINLMSIHGSKGLQSKVVFLLNDLDNRYISKNIFFNNDINNPLLIISPTKEIKSKKIIDLENNSKQLNLEESKRLLYVAITRAEEQLYIASISNSISSDKEKDSHLWWKVINYNLDSLLEEVEDKFFTKELGFISNKVLKTQYLKKEEQIEITKEQYKVPQWVKELARVEPSPSKPLTPSKLIFDDEFFISPLDIISKKSTKKDKLINKGSIIHKILEQLNYISVTDHELFINNFLNIQSKLSKKDKGEIRNALLNIIQNPEFQFLFEGKIFNEVSLSGKIHNEYGEEIILSARIDRLVKTDNEILIVDYKFAKKKTNISKDYLKQINLYKKLVKSIYPEHKIRGFILFSLSADIVEIK